MDQVLTCRDRGCAEARATTGAEDAAGPCIAVIDTTAIELRDETRLPLDHHHHPAHVVMLQHRQSTPDARVSRTRYLARGRWLRGSLADDRILSRILFAADDVRSALRFDSSSCRSPGISGDVVELQLVQLVRFNLALQ